jgi:hydrogenase maturation protease
MKPLVIGFGNPLRGDDGVGPRAAERVELSAAPETIDVVRCHQLTPELAAAIQAASVVIFLDAAADQEAGTVTSRPVVPSVPASWSHDLSPGQLLALAGQLTEAIPPAFLVTGGIRSTDFADRLSPEGERLAADMAAAALAYCLPAQDPQAFPIARWSAAS